MRIDEGIFVTACCYFKEIFDMSEEELGNVIDWEETGDSKFKISIEEYNAVQDIIALEMSYFCLRRVTHCCGSNTDAISSMLRKKRRDYEEKYEKEYQQLNLGKLS